MSSLERRCDQLGIQTYIKLESILLKPVTAVVDVEAVVEQYSEFDGNALHIQLAIPKQMIGTTEVTLQVVLLCRNSSAWIQLFVVFSHKSSNLFVCC